LEDLAAALREGSTQGALPALQAPSGGRDGILDRLTVREGSRLRIVPVSSIHWIESSGNYVTIHAGSRRLLHRVTLAQLEQKLPPRAFARIHRGAIVNVAEIVEVRCSHHGDGEVQLKDGTILRMSRRYRDALE
jgi:two-component system LytT family response regulator